MKKIGFILILPLPLLIFSQENFEGIITYQTEKYGINSSMTMFFGKSKIKIESSVSYEDSLQVFNQKFGGIFDFIKGTSIQYSSFTERYEIDTLNNEKEEDELATNERKDSSITIAGVICNKLFFNVDTINKTDISKTFIWYSDELKYIVPDEYRNKLSLPSDGNMLWLESINIISYYHPLKQAMIIDTITTKAISIQKTMLSDSVFYIPTNYKLDDGSPKSTWDVIGRQYEKSLKSPPKKSSNQKSGNN